MDPSVRPPLQQRQQTSKFLRYKNVLIFLLNEEFSVFKPNLGPTNSHSRNSARLFQQTGGMLLKPMFFYMLNHDHSVCHKTSTLVKGEDK